MKIAVLRKASSCFLAALLLVAMATLAKAGPVSIRVTDAEAGGMSGGKQAITFWMTVKNTSSDDTIRRLNSVTVEVHGAWGDGREETYRRNVTVDWTFDPELGPGKTKKLKTRFMRNVNPDKGWHKYRSVRVRVLKYNVKAG